MDVTLDVWDVLALMAVAAMGGYWIGHVRGYGAADKVFTPAVQHLKEALRSMGIDDPHETPHDFASDSESPTECARCGEGVSHSLHRPSR